MAVGSSLRHSSVDLATTPKPSGTSDIDSTTTPCRVRRGRARASQPASPSARQSVTQSVSQSASSSSGGAQRRDDDDDAGSARRPFGAAAALAVAVAVAVSAPSPRCRRTWLAGVLSVMRPKPDLSTWLPYKKDISAEGFTHTLCLAYAASKSNAVTWERRIGHRTHGRPASAPRQPVRRRRSDYSRVVRHAPRQQEGGATSVGCCPFGRWCASAWYL
eukprot:scaffold2418_cov296-Prasinococcus_capsulatus_cf.AAC.1